MECSSGSQGTCPLSPRNGVSWRIEDRGAPSFLHSSRQSSWITASLRTNSALVLVKEAECHGWYQISSLLPALHNLGLYLKLFLFLLVFYWKYSFIQSILITVSPLPSPPRPFPPPHPPNSVSFFSLSIEKGQEKKTQFLLFSSGNFFSLSSVEQGREIRGFFFSNPMFRAPRQILRFPHRSNIPCSKAGSVVPTQI